MLKSSRYDLSAPRPWVARPRGTGSFPPWDVLAPKRYAKEREQVIASWLSEEDAKAVATAPEAADFVMAYIRGEPEEQLRAMAKAIAQRLELGPPEDPVAEDEELARRGA